MYTKHWGLRESPFRGSLDPRYYFNSPSHDEALARLQFVVENQRRLALMLGPSGSGKSLLLEVFARQLRRAGSQVVLLRLMGMDGHEFLWQVARQLGADLDPEASVSRIWRSLSDRLTINRYQHINTILLLDDVDEASGEVLTSITRLVAWEAAPESRLAIVLGARESCLARLDRRLLELCELRIDILPWEQDDTAEYLKSALEKAGRKEPVFDVQAIRCLHDLTGGIPRRARQLAELALLAAAGQEMEFIDAQTIETVNQELLVEAATPVTC
jgi:type II secretory pathway predicted ATPase ExeA